VRKGTFSILVYFKPSFCNPRLIVLGLHFNFAFLAICNVTFWSSLMGFLYFFEFFFCKIRRPLVTLSSIFQDFTIFKNCPIFLVCFQRFQILLALNASSAGLGRPHIIFQKKTFLANYFRKNLDRPEIKGISLGFFLGP